MRLSKQRAQRAHAKRRALERFGLDLNRYEIRALVEDIQHGRGVFVESQSHRVSHWMVQVAGRWLRVVYDKHRKTIVTFLPDPEAA